MIFAINLLYIKWPNIWTSVLPGAEIFQQPSIYTPKYNITTNHVQIEPLVCENGQYKMFSLDFSISYATTIVNFLPLILNHFCIGDDKISMERFTAKPHVVRISKESEDNTTIIPLPGYKRNIQGFSFTIRNLFLDENYDVLKTGCIYISFYRNLYFGLEPTETLLRKMIKDLRKLLLLPVNDNDRYAFRFSVETTRSNLLNLDSPLRPVYTNLFAFVFSSDGLSVKLVEVNPENYHMMKTDTPDEAEEGSFCTIS